MPDGMFGDLTATTPVRATGRNIDIWMQAGPRARLAPAAERNQMTWHGHPVNERARPKAADRQFRVAARRRRAARRASWPTRC
jgi:hypothetical protein